MNILIVDDDPAVAELVAACLRKLGAKIETVTSFGAAKEYLQGKTVDLILLDIGLPDSFADKTILRVAELRNGTTKIVIITGGWPPGALMSPAETGADAVLFKGDADIIPKLEALCAQ